MESDFLRFSQPQNCQNGGQKSQFYKNSPLDFFYFFNKEEERSSLVQKPSKSAIFTFYKSEKIAL